ncbi:hypothetical protein [Solibacillus sp. CAU 1738]|uniref:hypothetical protein n=1 Tax=Solibacillus sp. CAU 1738 TaxID=3140363 RepID=UPI0032606855
MNNLSPLELFELLKPKIQKELLQTDQQNRADLEQEIFLKILEVLKTKDFHEIPTFFELLEKERNLK